LRNDAKQSVSSQGWIANQHQSKHNEDVGFRINALTSSVDLVVFDPSVNNLELQRVAIALQNPA